MKPALRRLALALAFLTRLPVRVDAGDERDVGRSVAFFPLVGALLGAALALLAWLVGGRLPDSVLAVLVTALLAALTGGLHLDGVADTFDALGAPGADRARLLEILRDSRIGAHGATALLLVVLLQVTALHAVLAAPHATPILLACLAVARFVAALVIVLFPYARTSGLGVAFHAHARRADVVVAGVVAALFVLAAGRAALLASLLATGVVLLFVQRVASRLGGVTGDVCGAAIELAQVAFLVAFLAAS
ncbi:adenosylcobinamide-GDP ribazoletransferase [Candidatus Binatia bacterium]|nr:adenosylcobinamide-GDP ribazoletransferase [Candidatus Binatia bacterium]